ncbi:MAG TPA: phosphopentomutase [Ignavibacteriales bacterium]|mgnify:CR=1 FL=1|nr:phosphopentomutase [Ignavibacteriales bacterium]HOL80149.1 phosphopentomutase [Ignavibacteriales bacterium]HOM64431.1 phosphopentomutase [Ignavibacteriales bacterium]HPD67918.1 phosphopentomutase [Ignavibacteriales bacterium]HPP32338.1 phosphopentomutase [Ignavibacteriales bacterium]
MKNFHVIVLDGVGVGELPDAHLYNDEGSNTLGNMAEHLGGITLPNLEKLGLGNIIDIKGISKIDKPIASYGKMAEVSKGKDSITGHWEIAGLKVEVDFPYYPEGFPKEIIDLFCKEAGVDGVLGNKVASGTEIIKELGDEHIKTGYPIVYTSADSVFQIAAHEDYFGLDRLYKICEVARNVVFTGNRNIGRVIARPFIGESGNYTRTTNRKDYAIDPPQDTILNVLQKNGIKTVAIGKINDLFNYSGIDEKIKTKSNNEGVEKVLEWAKKVNNSFIFTNLVDFDVYYGHRNDPVGFYNALKEFDNQLPTILNALDDDDALVITADHGNDPITPSTDHSREYVPVLFYRKNKAGKNLGVRKTFSDVGKTVAEFFGVSNELQGTSFLND